jgi:hypothetical protein
MAIDTSWANVSLLCPFSVDAQDVKGKVITPLSGAALSSAVGTPFGAGNAMHFDGTNDYATTPAQRRLRFGSGDFAIEAWVYIAGTRRLTVAAIGGVHCGELPQQRRVGLVIAGNGSTTVTGIYLSYWNGSSWTTIVSANHDEFRRVHGTTSWPSAWATATQIWLDAASATTGTNSTNMSLGQLMNFGGISTHTSYVKWLNGYISDLRITQGVGRTVAAAPLCPLPSSDYQRARL